VLRRQSLQDRPLSPLARASCASVLSRPADIVAAPPASRLRATSAMRTTVSWMGYIALTAEIRVWRAPQTSLGMAPTGARRPSETLLWVVVVRSLVAAKTNYRNRGPGMTRRINSLIAICAFFCISGCALQYQFEGVSYASRSDALVAQQRQLNAVLAAIVPVVNPLGGRATVILPSLALTKAKAVTRTGNPSDDTVEFIAETISNVWVGNVDGLRRGQVFDSVTLVLSDAPAEAARTAGGDFIVWLDLIDANTAQWYGASASGNIIALPVDTGVPVGAQRLQKWVNLVSEALEHFSEPAATSTRRRR
jgi:hypothetical protein